MHKSVVNSVTIREGVSNPGWLPRTQIRLLLSVPQLLLANIKSHLVSHHHSHLSLQLQLQRQLRHLPPPNRTTTSKEQSETNSRYIGKTRNIEDPDNHHGYYCAEIDTCADNLVLDKLFYLSTRQDETLMLAVSTQRFLAQLKASQLYVSHSLWLSSRNLYLGNQWSFILWEADKNSLIPPQQLCDNGLQCNPITCQYSSNSIHGIHNPRTDHYPIPVLWLYLLHPHLPLHQPQTPGWQLDWTYQPTKQNGPVMTNVSNIKRLPTPLINLSMQPFRTWIHPITLSYHWGGGALCPLQHLPYWWLQLNWGFVISLTNSPEDSGHNRHTSTFVNRTWRNRE